MIALNRSTAILKHVLKAASVRLHTVNWEGNNSLKKAKPDARPSILTGQANAHAMPAPAPGS